MPETLLAHRCVGDICNLVAKEPSVVGCDCMWEDVLRKVLEHPATRHVYVVDDARRLIGSVRLDMLMKHLFPYATLEGRGEQFTLGAGAALAPDGICDIMHSSPRHVREDTPVMEAIRIMMEERISELPVLDAERRVTGELNVLEIISGYLRAREAAGD